MEEFDEEKAAKEAIASSPDVTEGIELLSEPQEAVKSLQQAVNVEPTQEDQRNARLLTKGLRSISSEKGGVLDDDQLEALEGVAAEAFGVLSGLKAPKAVKLGITLALVALPLIPVFLTAKSVLTDTKEEESLDVIN